MEIHPHDLIALATELEKEGQYNGAKLLRAASAALVTRTSVDVDAPTDPPAQADRLRDIAAALADGPTATLAEPMRAAANALVESTVPMYDATPDPFVCRICGLVRTAPFPERCPDCGRWPTTAERFRPIYWSRESTPPEAIERLRSTPDVVVELLGRGDPNRSGPDGGWSAPQTLEHLHNAQQVFRGRIDQLLAGDGALASVMVWTMDGSAPTTDDLLAAYTDLRREIVELLTDVAPEAWWNAADHEEFGRVSLAEQASYFANHEPTHLAQMADAAG